MKEVWSPGKQASENHKRKPPLLRVGRQRFFETVAGVFAVALGAGCGNIEIRSPIVIKTPTPTPSELPEGMPSATIELIETPTPTPTPKPSPTRIPTATPTRIPATE